MKIKCIFFLLPTVGFYQKKIPFSFVLLHNIVKQQRRRAKDVWFCSQSSLHVARRPDRRGLCTSGEEEAEGWSNGVLISHRISGFIVAPCSRMHPHATSERILNYLKNPTAFSETRVSHTDSTSQRFATLIEIKRFCLNFWWFEDSIQQIDALAEEDACKMNECKLGKMEQLMVLKVDQSSAILLINWINTSRQSSVNPLITLINVVLFSFPRFGPLSLCTYICEIIN